VAMSGGARAGSSAKWSALWGLGMVLIFVGERIVGSGGGASRAVATLGGLALALGALGARARRASQATAERRRAEGLLLRLYALGLLAVALYVAQSDLPTLRGGYPLEHSSPKLATALAALWPALWVAAAWPIALMEMAYAQMAKAPRLETGRIKDAMYSGFGVAFALVFVFTVVYVSSERDHKLDLAYFRTARPGEVVRKMVRTLDQPLEIASFFPSGNEVREEVDNYLTDLAKESGQLTITHYDYDIDPLKAKELGVTTNGTLVFVRGHRHELLGIPVSFEAARSALKTLDKEVQQRLMLIVRQTKSAVFTTGHGERTWEPAASATDKRAQLTKLRELLLDQSYDLRTYGPSDGLMEEVPKDATVLVIMGPTRPFSPDESAAVNKYLKNGGRALIALDPENHVDLKEILDPLQLEYHSVTLANDQAYVRRTHTDADRTNLVTATFSSHPSVTTLLRLGARAPAIFLGAGWIDAKRGRPIEYQVDAPVKAHYSTFIDKNNNFQFDPDEQRRAWELAGAVSKGSMRAFVIADSDCFADEAIQAPGDELLTLDVMHWLMGDEAYQGLVSSEMDLPITHTRKQDVAWFYATIFVAPALVLGVGWLTTKRRRRSGGAPAAPGARGAAS
jgi:gliding motility-associatede transport system auxiliary component